LPALPDCIIPSLPSPVLTSHAHPEPNSVAAAFENSLIKLSKEPKLISKAAFSLSLGSLQPSLLNCSK